MLEFRPATDVITFELGATAAAPIVAWADRAVPEIGVVAVAVAAVPTFGWAGRPVPELGAATAAPVVGCRTTLELGAVAAVTTFDWAGRPVPELGAAAAVTTFG